jgi:P pilus assembly chaperone PapD
MIKKTGYLILIIWLFSMIGFSQGTNAGVRVDPVRTETKKKETKKKTVSNSTKKPVIGKNTIKANVIKARVIVTNANFRISPSNDAESLGLVKYGEVLVIIDKNHFNGWYNVKHIPTNITGWVYGDTIEFIK